MNDTAKAIGVYKTSQQAKGGTGWAAYSKEGRTWPVTADEAATIEAKGGEK